MAFEARKRELLYNGLMCDVVTMKNNIVKLVYNVAHPTIGDVDIFVCDIETELAKIKELSAEIHKVLES